MSAAKGGSSDLIELVYFPVRGRAEPLRLCFKASGTPYKDTKVVNWEAEKKKAPYGLVPYIIYDGKKYGESKALASFVARECGMAGKTNVDAMRVDEIYSLYICLLEGLAGVHFAEAGKKKDELKKILEEETIPKYLKFFEEKIKGGFCVGTSLTLADTAIYNITETILAGNGDALKDYTGIQQCRKNVEENEGVKAYLATRGKTPI